MLHPDTEYPLVNETFDPVKEWVLDVPLLLQVQLLTLCNKKHMRQSKNPDAFLKTKVERLYGIYENILKLKNKKFCGLMQQQNTKKLIMGFKSVSTVFDVTSKQGITLSLKGAEKQLIDQSQENKSYYNTYLKEYDMTYETNGGLVTKPVRLRDCFIILMMDNLVRLKYSDDPNPGESRTKQLNTLPITLQGLPKDSIEVSSWHDVDICDGTDECFCKNNHILTPRDVDKALLSLTASEEETWEKYNQLCTWNQPKF